MDAGKLMAVYQLVGVCGSRKVLTNILNAYPVEAQVFGVTNYGSGVRTGS